MAHYPKRTAECIFQNAMTIVRGVTIPIFSGSGIVSNRARIGIAWIQIIVWEDQ